MQFKEQLPLVLTETMKWLTDEVLTPQNNEVRAEVNEEQRTYEAQLAAEIAQAGEALRRRREEASRILRETPSGNGQVNE